MKLSLLLSSLCVASPVGGFACQSATSTLDDSFVVGGQAIQIKTAPWQGALFVGTPVGTDGLGKVHDQIAQATHRDGVTDPPITEIDAGDGLPPIFYMQACGASLIKDPDHQWKSAWALTAAHCIIPSELLGPDEPPLVYKLMFGSADLKCGLGLVSDPDTEPSGYCRRTVIVDVDPEAVLFHPYADLALVPLPEPVQFEKDQIEAIELYPAQAFEDHRDQAPSDAAAAAAPAFTRPSWPADSAAAFTSGWGMAVGPSSIYYPDDLRAASLQVMNAEMAELAIANISDSIGSLFFTGLLPEEIAMVKPEEEKLAVGDGLELASGGDCWGDSGGPLAIFEGEQWKLLGTVSWGPDGCGVYGVPSVFAYVGAARQWIDDAMAGVLPEPDAAPPSGESCESQSLDKLPAPAESDDCSEAYSDTERVWRCIMHKGKPASQVCDFMLGDNETPRWYTFHTLIEDCCACQDATSPHTGGIPPGCSRDR